MTTDTTDISYWLNWRFFLCAIWLLIAMIVAAVLIWQFEGPNRSRKNRHGEDQRETLGSVYQGDAWKTCLKSIHPKWLLGYRLISFCILLTLILSDIIVNGGGIFYYYTEWTFALVTIYFGLGSAFSLYGCLHCWKEIGDGRANVENRDSERGTYVAPTLGEYENRPSTLRSLNSHEKPLVQTNAGFWGYTFQIVYQICAGAVALTDVVYWLIIYPFLTDQDYRLNFLIVCMHSVNAVFFLGEVFLNHLRFPFFRLAYFALYTSMFVIFQWIIHMCVSLWWPYPFLDLSARYAPLWYVAVGLLHLPCYGLFSLIERAKQFLLSRMYQEFNLNETR